MGRAPSTSTCHPTLRRSAPPLEERRRWAGALTPVTLVRADRTTFQSRSMITGRNPFTHSNSLKMSVPSPRNSMPFLAGNYTLTADEHGGLQPVQRQRELQLMPSGRQVNRPTPPPPQGLLRTPKTLAQQQHEPCVHVLWLCQSRPSQESEGLVLLRDHAGFLWIYP